MANSKIENLGKVKFLHHNFDYEVDVDDLRQLVLQSQNQQDGIVSILSSLDADRMVLVIASDSAARENGFKAGALAKLASEILGGGGGGKDDFAQGGGPKKEKLSEAIAAIKNILSK